MFATVPSPVIWDGMFQVLVHCSSAAPAPCTGSVIVKAREGSAESEYSVAAGRAKRITVDPGFGIKKTEKTVTVRLESPPDAPVEVTRSVSFRGNGGTGGTGDPIVHVVHDKRGDAGGSNVLDLRVVRAWIHRGRLVLRWTCWGTVTPAKMDHDSSNFSGQVFTSENLRNPYHVAFFYWHGHPFAQAGRTQFGNPNVRTSLPDRHSAQMAIPLSTFGRHPRQFYIQMQSNPYVGPHSWTDSADSSQLHIKVS